MVANQEAVLEQAGLVPGQQLWLRGERVVFVEYYRRAARVRGLHDEALRCVSAEKLAATRTESIRLAATIRVD